MKKLLRTSGNLVDVINCCKTNASKDILNSWKYKTNKITFRVILWGFLFRKYMAAKAMVY